MARRSAVEVGTGLAVLVAAAGFIAYAGTNTGRRSASGTELVARFDNVGALAVGSDVKVGGVSVGRVVSTAIDPASYQAVVHFTIQPDIKLPTDSSAVVASGGLLGSAFLSLSPGGAEATIQPGGTVTITQSATNLEDLLGKFIFNVGSLADATQRSLKDRTDPKP